MPRRDKALTLEGSLERQLNRALQDPYGQNWPDSLLASLNAVYKDFPAKVLERARVVGGEAGAKIIALQEARPLLRQRQQELRALVDSFLEGRDEDGVVTRLQEILDRQPYRVVLQREGKEGQRPRKNGPLVRLHHLPVQPSGLEEAGGFLGFARLLESNTRKQLRKCPECETYFLARRGKRQKCCSARCRRRARKRYLKGKYPKAYKAQKAAEMKRYRQRKKHQTT